MKPISLTVCLLVPFHPVLLDPDSISPQGHLFTFPQSFPTLRAISIAKSESAKFPFFRYLRNIHSFSNKLLFYFVAEERA